MSIYVYQITSTILEPKYWNTRTGLWQNKNIGEILIVIIEQTHEKLQKG